MVSTYNFATVGKKSRETNTLHTSFLIGSHSMKGRTVTTKHGVTRTRSTNRLKRINLFSKILQIKDVC